MVTLAPALERLNTVFKPATASVPELAPLGVYVRSSGPVVPLTVTNCPPALMLAVSTPEKLTGAVRAFGDGLGGQVNRNRAAGSVEVQRVAGRGVAAFDVQPDVKG